jgi:hypothetical protein
VNVTNLPAPYMWFRPEVDSVVVLTGNKVAAWLDRSGNNLHLNSTTSTFPDYVPAVGEGFTSRAFPSIVVSSGEDETVRGLSSGLKASCLCEWGGVQPIPCAHGQLA